jgi:archaemetzincin
VNRIQLLSVGDVDARLLTELSGWLGQEFAHPCAFLDTNLDPAFAFHTDRGQYNSTEILSRMHSFASSGCWRLLGVTARDLYIPILTFVFGEAQMGDSCALVSYHRLRQEFYGLPPDDKSLHDRLCKEAAHELGHTLGLTHCDDYGCVMAPSHAVEWIDLKGSAFCDVCRSRLARAGETNAAPQATPQEKCKLPG